MFALSSALARGLSLLLLPVITHFIQPADYGYLITLQLYLAFGIAVLGSTTQASLPRTLVQQGREPASRLIPALLAVILMAVIGGTVLTSFLVLTPLDEWMHLALPPVWLLAVPLLVAGEVVWLYHLSVLRFEERSVTYAVSEIARNIAGFSAALLMLLASFGWQGVALANGSVTFIAAIVALRQLRRAQLIGPWPNRVAVRAAIGEAVVLLPHALGSFVIALADRLMLGIGFGRTVVGIYGVGYSFGASVSLATESINRALAPRVYRDLGDQSPERMQRLVRIIYYYSFGALAIAALAAVVARWLIPVLTAPEYHGATRFVGWVSLAFAVNGIYSVLFPFIVHSGETAYLGRATLLAALVNVALTAVLMQTMGPVGAAVATFVAYLLRLALVWERVARRVALPWPMRRAPQVTS